MTAAALALCACIKRSSEREREGKRVFWLLLFACITSCKREREFLQFTVCYTQKKKYWAHCEALRSLFLSLTLFEYYIVVYVWFCFFYLLYSFLFCLLLSAPLLRCCCCCFFFFFYIVTNTQKQLKNNNIKKIPKPKNLLNCSCCCCCYCCRRECCLFLYLNHFLFVFFLLRILNFDVERNMFLFVLLSPARLPAKSPPRLLFQARFFILKITFCFSPLSFFHS